MRAVQAVLSEGEVQLAISELTDAEALSLQMTARSLARVCSLAPEDLMSEAIGRVMEGTRTVPRMVKLVVALRGVMRSLAWNDRKLHDNAKVDSGDDEVLNNVPDAALSPEDELVKKDLRKGVLELFEGDAHAQAICEGHFFEDMSEKELCELTGLNATKLVSKKRAITRALAKSNVGAHLK